MMLILDNDVLPYKEDAQMAIITTNEGGQTRASVVLYYTMEDQKVVGPHMEGSLADSDSEALLSLYKDSKLWTGQAKAEMIQRGLWR